MYYRWWSGKRNTVSIFSRTSISKRVNHDRPLLVLVHRLLYALEVQLVLQISECVTRTFFCCIRVLFGRESRKRVLKRQSHSIYNGIPL